MPKRSAHESRSTATAGDELFRSIARQLMEDARVSQSRMFGASRLSVNGKYFAMLYKANLVVKLPKARATQVVAGRDGAPFDPGHGRIMREWVAVTPAKRSAWRRFAREAMDFVAGASPQVSRSTRTKGRASTGQTRVEPRR